MSYPTIIQTRNGASVAEKHTAALKTCSQAAVLLPLSLHVEWLLKQCYCNPHQQQLQKQKMPKFSPREPGGSEFIVSMDR